MYQLVGIKTCGKFFTSFFISFEFFRMSMSYILFSHSPSEELYYHNIYGAHKILSLKMCYHIKTVSKNLLSIRLPCYNCITVKLTEYMNDLTLNWESSIPKNNKTVASKQPFIH